MTEASSEGSPAARQKAARQAKRDAQKMRRAKGTLPVAVKPLPKTGKAPAVPAGRGSAPVDAEASKNKMRARGRK